MHSTNKIEDIKDDYGAEIDVRDYNKNLVLSHNYPDENSVKFTEYLNHFPKNSLLAINVKSCEIENDLKKTLELVQHENYFTFDFSIPYLLKAIKFGLKCAFRLSEYEKQIHSSCEWVWVDSFHSIWYDASFLESLRKSSLRIALVSPELHNRKEQSEFKKIKEMASIGLVDAICTDSPHIW